MMTQYAIIQICMHITAQYRVKQQYLNAKAEPIDFVDLFLNKAFNDMICMETNYYATQTLGQPLADDIKFTTEELKA